MYWPWIELGLSGPSDLETVKHTYAQRLKEVHPEEDPEGFQRLHRAYTAARRLAALMERGEPVPPPLESLPQEEPPSQLPPAEPSQPEDVWNFEDLLGDDGTEQEPDWQEPCSTPSPLSPTARRLGWLLFALLGGLCCLIIVPLLLARSIPNTDQRNAQQLQFQLDFLHGDALILEYLSGEDPLPDGPELTQSYEDNLGPSMLLTLVNDHGVANWDYPDLDAVSILRQGDEGQVLDDPCWWITCHGTDLSGKAQTINYFLNKDFTRIYAISQDVLDGGGEDVILEEWDPIQLEYGCEIAVWRSRS